MKVFISWSGELSKQLGEALRNWLPSVLQSVRPYFTPSDIEKGSKWSDEISKNLEESSFGLLCITRESLSSEWMLFEAGALSKHVGKSFVCPILFNVENSDLSGPYSLFQTTIFSKKDIRSLLTTINSQSEHKLDSNVLNGVFDMWWPKLEKDITDVLKSYQPEDPQRNRRTDRDLIEEILELTRSVNKRRRAEINERVIIDLVGARNLIANECIISFNTVIAGYIIDMDRPLMHLIHRLKISDEELYLRLLNEYVDISMINEDFMK